MEPQFDAAAFARDGYSVFRVLSLEQAAHCAAVAENLNGGERPAEQAVRASTGGADVFECPELAELAFHPVLIGAAATALRCRPEEILLDNMKLYFAEKGEVYKQGWHRVRLPPARRS